MTQLAMKEQEEWREIPEWPGYEVSSLGRVRSWKKKIGRRSNPIIRSPHQMKNGYLLVGFKDGGRKNAFLVHRLVLLAFRGEAPAGMEARHLNGICTDNRLCNLAWSTHLSNIRDKFRHGTNGNGMRNAAAKLSEEDVREIRRLAQEGRVYQRDIAAQFGIGQSQVSRIKKGIEWSHLA